MAMNVTARTIPLRAVQNHSEPGPMNAIPSVLMNFTSAPLVLRPRWADDRGGWTGGQGVGPERDDGTEALAGNSLNVVIRPIRSTQGRPPAARRGWTLPSVFATTGPERRPWSASSPLQVRADSPCRPRS